ncbi:hypothetical protein DM02DRAFT_654215 [Periconia macrospinosa]|uniref:Amidohydrolase-related domain-containing protein n=1 Tax=Periconia macrospinosa TaxID=97972 RepID=A0A2V1DUK1_9PLEO|nr:hypothetical protein DM02DRAFT_654215 [Periconia macrospinosa]
MQFSHLSSSSTNMIRRSVPAGFNKTAITNVRVFDGSCFTPPQTVIIDKDQISSNATNVATTINATGLFLIPGLIDKHIHISSIAGLENATSYGITTGMNMACRNYTICKTLRGQPGFPISKAPVFPS